MPLTSKGKKIIRNMRKTYGSKKGERIFYASKNAGKISGVDKGFYGHMTHSSIQSNEDSVSIIGNKEPDVDFPKKPITDKFMECSKSIF